MRYIVFVILISLWTPITSQTYPSHAYELIFRFDTAITYPGVKKIKHTTFIEGEKIKHRSAILLLNQKGQSLRPDGPTYWPYHPLFMLLHQFSDMPNKSIVRYKLDSLGRYIMKTFYDPTMSDDSTKYLLEYSEGSQRPNSVKEYRYLSREGTTILIESIDLEYFHDEIIVTYPDAENIALHYEFNQLGDLIKFYGEDICDGCQVVFSDKNWWNSLALGSIPLEFHYEYDKKGRVTAMYETTDGKRELLFKRKYIPK